MLRGRFRNTDAEIEWCNRRILARIHRATLWRLRREIEPVTALDFERFLHVWQHVSPGSQLHGADGTLQMIRQLQGYEIPAAAWEPEILARRIGKYDPEFLDEICLSGRGDVGESIAASRNCGEPSCAAHPYSTDNALSARRCRVVNV